MRITLFQSVIGADRAMTLYALKPAFQAWLRPVVGRLAEAGVTANQVTVAAMLGSILVGALAALGPPGAFLLIPLWLAVRMALNAVDGMLAREFGQKSPLGAYLNEVGDVVSDVTLYAAFALVPAIGPLPVAVAVMLAILTEFVGVLGLMVGASRRYDGPMGKSDRALAFGALATWIGLGLPLGSWAAILLWLMALLLALTSVHRARCGLREAAAATRDDLR
jgi:CDP-diacylglycerol--glycerol-3-phosphate 3-phosphatidyltransferase